MMKPLKVSVIIPTHNRPDRLAETLAGLYRQTLSAGEHEIIVVDDGSQPPVVLSDANTGIACRLVRLEGEERSAARNAGARAACGELLVFVDDDLSIPPEFLRAHLDASEKWPGALQVGAVRLPGDVLKTPFGRFRQSLEDRGLPQLEGIALSPHFCTAQNMAIPRSLFHQLGGFEPDIVSSEDQDLALRHTAAGGPIVFVPGATAIHNDSAVDIRSYCRRAEWGSEYMIPFCHRYADLPENVARERVNGPVRWGEEPLGQSMRKAAKSVLSIRPVTAVLFRFCSVLERCAPNSKLLDRVYRLLLGGPSFAWVSARSEAPRKDKAGSFSLFNFASASPKNRWSLMLRILHFAQDSDTSGFFPQLARWHDRTRYQMFFGTLNPIAPWLREAMESQGVQCISCDCRRQLSYPLGMLRLARFLRQQRIDILHTHLFEPSVIGLSASVLARTRLRVMTRHYSDYHTRINKKWHVRLDQFCNRLSHAVIAVSQHTAEHMISEEGTSPAKIHTILNGIDLDRVKLSSPDAPARLRREFGADGAYLLLMVGRLHPEKGYTYLFQAMAKLKGRLDHPIRLLVAGKGPFEEAYKNEVAALECAESVRFLGFRKDVPDLMAAADIVVLSSLAEAFGLVLTEALYLGTPVIATRVGGIPEIIADGVDGLLVPPADSVALADAIANLLSDPERRRNMAGAGRQKVQDRFRFADMVRSYEAVYERLT